jgi:uncharacterized protein YjbI with pentapeptide repeats
MAKRRQLYRTAQSEPKRESSALARGVTDDCTARKSAEETFPNSERLAHIANDLEAIQKSVADASSVSTGLWLSYLFVLFYFAVAAGAVTHTDLLLETPVKLPFLNIQLPLRAFFFLSPLIFIVMHTYTLIHIVFLARKAVRFHNRLYEEFPGGAKSPNSSIRDGLRQQLPSNIFVQFLAGPVESRISAFGYLLKIVAWTTLVFGPVALLLLFQIQFLAYHHSPITWVHRAAVMTDLLIIWWLWRKIVGGRVDSGHWSAWKMRVKASIALMAGASAALFSWTVATFPGEWQQAPLEWVASAEPTRISTAVFNGDVDSVTRSRTSWFSNTLVVPGLNLDEARKGELNGHSLDLRGRHLEGGVFEGTNFGRVADFTGAYLQGASFDRARLQGASFDSARLQGASLDFAWLQGALFHRAQLLGTSLYGASLQGASFFDADLRGTRLDDAHLHGASFFLARLAAMTLERSELYGASFERAKLVGVDLSLSYLWRTVWEEGETTARAVRAEATRWEPFVTPCAPSGGGEIFICTGKAPWDEAVYNALRSELETSLEGQPRTEALRRIAQLDCGAQALTPCDQATSVPQVLANATKSGDVAFAEAVAEEIERLVCTDPAKGHRYYTVAGAHERGSSAAFDAIMILRGLIRHSSLRVIGGPPVSRFLDSDCLVSALITETDKVGLAR